MNCAHCRQLLDAWLDGEVDRATADSIEAHFARCPECEAARRERERLRALVRAASRPETVPADVAARIRATLGAGIALPAPAVRRPTWPVAFTMAAASAAFAAFVTVAIVHPDARPDSGLEQLVDRHVGALSAGASSGTPLVQFTSGEQHQLKPWFQGRVPLSPPVVDLASEGFELLGGRVERVGSREAAVVVYRIRKHPIDVFAWRDAAPDAPPRASTLRGFSVVRWNADGLAFAAISDLNAPDLERLARLLGAGLPGNP